MNQSARGGRGCAAPQGVGASARPNSVAAARGDSVTDGGDAGPASATTSHGRTGRPERRTPGFFFRS